ncbi:MAG: acyl carrier protein [Anaerolineales bacterium]|jgi:acyl carrier protein
MRSIEEILRRYIADNILFCNNGYPYTDDDSFLENGILDSTNILELVMLVEEEFGIATDDNEISPDNFDSVSKLSRFTRSKMDSKVGGKI